MTNNSSFEKSFKNLESNYQNRKFNKHLKQNAIRLIINIFNKWVHRDVFQFSAEELAGLSSCIEILDYFNHFDENLGVNNKIDKGELYCWALDKGEKLSLQISSLPLPAGTEEDRLYIERIRFIAVTVLNEQYRKGDDDCLKKMGELILSLEEVEAKFFKEEKISETYFRCIDNLSYLFFVNGKMNRSFGKYTEAQISFESSIVRLMELSKLHSQVVLDGVNEDLKYNHVHSKIMRIGVVHLACASLYLSWGKISKSSQQIELALKLLEKEDESSFYDALAIKGTILRIKSGKDEKAFSEAIDLLTSSFDYFTSKTNNPRRAIRNLFALETALLIKNDLPAAIKNLEKLFDVIIPRNYKLYRKIFENKSWIVRLYIILSRISRNDHNNLYLEKLKKLSESLKNYLSTTNSSKIKLDDESLDYFNKSLDIAESHARSAIAIANPKTKEKLDARIALGELLIKKQKYEKAQIEFESVLEFCTKGESGEVRSNQALLIITLCHVNLANIYLNQNLLSKAEKSIADLDSLGEIEHRWIRELSEKVRENYIRATIEIIVVKVKKGQSVMGYQDEFERQLIRKFNIDKITLKDFNKIFPNSKNVYYRLRKIESE